MSLLPLERLRSRKFTTPTKVALPAGAIFQCPRCRGHLALMNATVFWTDLNWWEAVDSLGLDWDDKQCVCRFCQLSVATELCYNDNWDTLFVLINLPPQGDFPFV